MDSRTPIRDSIKEKGRKYGKTDKPLVVAVNFNCFTLDRISEMEALFGQEEYLVSPGCPTETRRKRNGVWVGATGPTYQRISGAWLFNDLGPFSIGARRGTFYFNPWADHPAPKLFTLIDHAAAKGERMEHHKGTKLLDLLELPENWPEE